MTTPETMANVDFIRVADQTGTPSTPAADYSAFYSKGKAPFFINEDGLEVDMSQAAKVVQIVNTQTGAVAVTSTAIPLDDTIPQNGEGGEMMTLAITPASTTNILYIDVVINASVADANDVIVALFQDATASALAAVCSYNGTGTARQNLTLRHKMAAGTTSATTFKVRCGAGTAVQLTLNGYSGNRIFGGVMASSITITEVTP